MTVTAAQLIAFVRAIPDQTLYTASKGKAFQVRTVGLAIEYIPSATGTARKDNYAQIIRFCDEFSRLNSLQPGDYQNVSFNASYALAVVEAYLKQIPTRQTGT